MKNKGIAIAGAGGIARAVGLILAEWGTDHLRIYIGNRNIDRAREAANWISGGCTKTSEIRSFHLPETQPYPSDVSKILGTCEVLIDCLPGSQAPRLAALALEKGLHYINLTEHVSATEEIVHMVSRSANAFVLQSGLAPGYINVLANGMFQRFCSSHRVDVVDGVYMRVGALTEHANAPSYYGFTWSPVGVATEYIEPAIVVRDFEKSELPSLSERQNLMIHKVMFEEDLTSGGAADLPDALAGKVKNLDYKTLRYPGHYEWVLMQLDSIKEIMPHAMITELQRRMENVIPHIEEDVVVIYAAVVGCDHAGVLRREEHASFIRPTKVGRQWLRAIQTTTAAPPAQIVLQLLDNKYSGVVQQSVIDPESLLGGQIVSRIYGEWKQETD